jgi:hypothetical protein
MVLAHFYERILPCNIAACMEAMEISATILFIEETMLRPFSIIENGRCMMSLRCYRQDEA